MNNTGKVLLGAGIVAGAILFVTRSAKGAAPPTEGFTLEVVNPGPTDTLFHFNFQGDLMWDPAYFPLMPKPTPIGQKITFPLFIPDGTIMNVLISHGTLNPDGSYTGGGLNYMASVTIQNARSYVFDATTRTIMP